MQNQNEVLKEQKVQTDSAGNAMKRYQTYSESTEAKVNDLKNSMQQLWQSVIKSSTINSAISILNNLVKGITTLGSISTTSKAEIATLTATIVALGLAIKSVGGLSSIKTAIEEVGVQAAASATQEALMTGVTTGLATAVKGLGMALEFLTTTPIGLLITGLGLATVALFKHIEAEKEDKKYADDLRTSYDALNKSIKNNSVKSSDSDYQKMKKTQDELTSAIKQHNSAQQKLSQLQKDEDEAEKNHINVVGNNAKERQQLIVTINNSEKSIEKITKALNSEGIAYDSVTGKIQKVQIAENLANAGNAIDKIKQKAEATKSVNETINNQAQEYLKLNSQQDKDVTTKTRMTQIANNLKGSIDGLTTETDKNGNVVITNTDLLSKQIQMFGKNQDAIITLENVELEESKVKQKVEVGKTEITYQEAKKRIEEYQKEIQAIKDVESAELDKVNEESQNADKNAQTIEKGTQAKINSKQSAINDMQAQLNDLDKLYSAAENENAGSNVNTDSSSGGESSFEPEAGESESAKEKADKKAKQLQEKALEGQVKDLEREKKAYDDQIETQQKNEQDRLDKIKDSLQAQLDILQKKKEQQEEMNSLIKDQNDLVKAQQNLQNAQLQKIQIMDANGNLVWVTDETKVSSAREKLGEAQNNLNVEKNNQAEKHQEENINAQIKQVEAQKEAYKAQYDNNKSAKDKAYESQIDALNQQKESLQGYREGTDDAEAGVKHVAEDSIEIVIGNQLREFEGGEVVLNGAKTNQIMNGANKVANVSNQNGNNQVGTNGINSQLNNMAKKAEQTTGESLISNKQLVKKPVTDLKNEITNEIIQYVNGTGQYSVEANKNVGTGISNSQDSVLNPTKTLINTTKNLITTFAQNTINDGLEIDKQIGKGITDGEKDLTKIVDDLCQKIVDEFKKDLDIHSPSRVLYQIGQFAVQGFVNGMSETDIEKLIKDKLTSMGGMINQQAVNISGSLQDWIHQAMQLTNTPDSWFNSLATIAMKESDGNPTNVNTYDSNFLAGHPSKGVMQMIDESFRDNMVSGHNNIFNPVDNIASAINYIRRRYGDVSNVPGIKSLARGGSYVGYQKGTPENGVPKADMYKINEDTRDGSELVFLNEGDQVINSKRSSILKKIADIVGQTGSLDKALYTSNLGIDTSNISLPSNINLNVNKPQTIENKKNINIENLNLTANNPGAFINGLEQYVKTL